MPLRQNKINRLLVSLFRYHLLRKYIKKIVYRFEKGEYYSLSLREIFKRYYGVQIGLYTYGECFQKGAVDPNTVIGRYCSIASNIRIMNRNHPITDFSTHPFFFNHVTGYIENDTLEYNSKKIGNDVWIGTGSIILPKVKTIGDGVIIGAGSVIVNDIPDFAIVAGNPGVVKRYRFPSEVIKFLKKDPWWNYGVETIINKKEEIRQMIKKYNPD